MVTVTAIAEAFFIVWFSGGGDFKVSFNDCNKLSVLIVKFYLKSCGEVTLWLFELVSTCISIRIVENGYENDMSPSACETSHNFSVPLEVLIPPMLPSACPFSVQIFVIKLYTLI